MMASGNIIKQDQDFGAVEKSPLLPLAIFCRMPIICVRSCQKLNEVSGAYIDKIQSGYSTID